MSKIWFWDMWRRWEEDVDDGILVERTKQGLKEFPQVLCVEMLSKIFPGLKSAIKRAKGKPFWVEIEVKKWGV